jgi:AcrR family transcriptional regulator
MARHYDNRRRSERAVRTRRRVIEAARSLILEAGYSATTISTVAARADVSVDTIYKGFGGKAGLFKALWDVTLAGDFEPVSMADRPSTKAIGDEADPVAKLAIYASLAAGVFSRIGPLLVAMRGTSGTDKDLGVLTNTLDTERLVGTGMLAEHLAATGSLRLGVAADHARDIIWAYISPEMYLLLVHDRAWSPEQYEDWLARALVSALLPTTPTRQL